MNPPLPHEDSDFDYTPKMSGLAWWCANPDAEPLEPLKSLESLESQDPSP